MPKWPRTSAVTKMSFYTLHVHLDISSSWLLVIFYFTRREVVRWELEDVTKSLPMRTLVLRA